MHQPRLTAIDPSGNEGRGSSASVSMLLLAGTYIIYEVLFRDAPGQSLPVIPLLVDC